MKKNNNIGVAAFFIAKRAAKKIHKFYERYKLDEKKRKEVEAEKAEEELK